MVMVLDPYWLHAYWEISPRSIQRAAAAMGQHWHAARPILRVHEVSRNGTTNTARLAVRDVEIHGGVNNWYLDVPNPPKSYQLEIGYLGEGDRFHSIARSNVVSTPGGCVAEFLRQELGRSGQGFRPHLRHERGLRGPRVARRVKGSAGRATPSPGG